MLVERASIPLAEEPSVLQLPISLVNYDDRFPPKKETDLSQLPSLFLTRQELLDRVRFFVVHSCGKRFRANVIIAVVILYPPTT